ncbi:MAG: PPC domain-containing DNA-binding protein [Limnoraphis robusta]
MMNVLPIRLKPNQDLKLSLQEIAVTHQIQAGFILTAVGSLQQATVRFAGQEESECLPRKTGLEQGRSRRIIFCYNSLSWLDNDNCDHL